MTVADFLGHEEHVKDDFHAGITQRLQVGIYTIPEVGMVGETEESLKKKGVAYTWDGRTIGKMRVAGSSATWMAFLSCSFVRTI